ncbi:MAG TPA: SDR family NAD(P)-dependent oxidoreductase [Candidatus Angelobacter sp.]|nr:SDR family NAD(P)-dependent oxidoreductase [Candidatus Angelobacter sp.]
MDWSNKVVLITGASSGIGRGLALELARRGAKLGLLARRKELLEELAAEISAENNQREVLILAADVQDASAMRQAGQHLSSKWGPVDVLIANAGVGVTNSGAEIDAEKLSAVININVVGAANSVAAVLPEMLARGCGHLVVLSSLAAYRGVPKSAAYCASKAGVSAMFESFRLDLEPSGINVTIIHPGFIRTPLTAGRKARLPWLMEVDQAVNKILGAIEKRKKSYAFPWQLATIVRLGMIMPNSIYDWLARRNSLRE